MRKDLETAVLAGRYAAEAGVRASLSVLGVQERDKPAHLSDEQARLRRGLRAKQRQLGGKHEVLVWDAAYEQWHRLLFARFLAENDLLLHPEYDAPVTLAECDELAEELGEPDGWSVAARFASEILPGIFRLDDPCLQLRLAPEHRIALERTVAGLPSEVFEADDSLGWVYQYWQSERKDQVNASEKKIGGADLGPVTQLFTENYMVRFLLENSLGAWWTARHPDSPLVETFEYLRFDDDGQPAAGRFEGWPDEAAEVTVMDPCCGSGHFLVEAFGMLWRMRAEEEGLDPVAAQDAVLRDNLFGLELDPRCVQIAMFAVALTAWKQGGGWRELPVPNIACSGIPARAPAEQWAQLAQGDVRLESALARLHRLFGSADTLGSLIDPRSTVEDARYDGAQRSLTQVALEEVAPFLNEAAKRETDDPARAVLGASAIGIARAASLLSGQYDLIATNVPYLGRAKQSPALINHLDEFFFLGRHDLGTAIAQRALSMVKLGGTVSIVVPDKLLYLGSYKELREELLRNATWNVVARLGAGSFSTPMYDMGVMLMSLSRLSPSLTSSTTTLNVADKVDPSQKAAGLRASTLEKTSQSSQLNNPDSRFTLRIDERFQMEPLSDWAYSHHGLSTGDTPRMVLFLWELDRISAEGKWVKYLNTPNGHDPFSGRSSILRWENGSGAINELPGARKDGTEAWGKNGVLIKSMGDLHCARYTGEPFDQNCAAMVPHDEALLDAIWVFLSSPQYPELVRLIDQKLKVTSATLMKVPFDVDHWRKEAAEAYPDGLPKPASVDPTQWLFEGRPEVSTEPLQVAVGRLMGYRWPEQPSDDLDELADDDGIVCLPAVAGELPAADRLHSLLARAYSNQWSPSLIRQLLEAAESKKKNLADWLLNDFFKQHCKLFSNRPFVWHIWDGRKDGFSALVNYHRLDRSGLEKLTYTYLGNWIERQRADAAEEVAGADTRLAAAQELKAKLEAILEGEPPYDIYVRWKELHEQPIGWDPDLDDGVRLNIRPFVEASVLRSKFTVHWRKDRGKNSDGSLRHNDLHFTVAEKRAARNEMGRP